MRTNKKELILKIQQLDGLTQEERSDLIDLINTRKRYGLVWEDKPEAAEEMLRTQLPVLREVVERRIMFEFGLSGLKDGQDSKKAKPVQSTLFEETENQENQENKGNPFHPIIPKNPNSNLPPNHILIEGDNLHALTALTFTHEGKIDVIYIDPPYNTGNKDFKYNDSFVDKEDSYRHSKWLSFMHKRLQIAKRLLSEKGVIFISIDDNEISELRILCEEVFGSENFVAQITLLCNPKGRSQDKYFNTNHEYLLAFAKSILEPGNFSVYKMNEEIQKDYKLNDERGNYRLLELRNTHREFNKQNRPNLYYPLYINPVSGEVSIEKSDFFSISSEPIWNDGYDGCWTWGKRNVIENRELLVGVNIKGKWKVFRKSYSETEDGFPVKKKLFSIWHDSSFYTEKGQNILGEIFPGFNKNDFPQPKSLAYIIQILYCSTTKTSTILDFFAGSGTTLHATMQLNAEDGGNRQCILVTNNENNICEEVTYERNRRVIQGYTNSKGEWIHGLTNNNLRYYKNEFVPSERTEQNKRLLAQCGTDLLCIKEDCYTELTAEIGFQPVQCRIFRNDGGRMMAVVYHSRRQSEVFEQLIAYIKTLDELTEPVKLYAFCPEKEILLEDFQEVADKIDAVALPEAIYNAYRATFKTLDLDQKPPVETTHALSPDIQAFSDDDNELSDTNPNEA